MSSPYPGFAQCRKAMKPDGSSPFPNKPSYQQCPDTWACHEADVGQTCFTPFSEKAGLVPKGGPPEDLCDNTCTCTTYKSFSTKCYDLASPSAGSAYCPLGTDCDRCGSRTTKTLGSYWVLAATHYSTGRRSSAVNCALGTSAARSSTWPFPTRLQRRRGRWSATPTRTPPKSSCSPTTPCSACTTLAGGITHRPRVIPRLRHISPQGTSLAKGCPLIAVVGRGTSTMSSARGGVHSLRRTVPMRATLLGGWSSWRGARCREGLCKKPIPVVRPVPPHRAARMSGPRSGHASQIRFHPCSPPAHHTIQVAGAAGSARRL